MPLSSKRQMFASLGGELVRAGHGFQRKAIGAKITKILTGAELKAELQKFGYDSKSIYCADKEYHLTKWTAWEDIIKYDLTNLVEYVSEVRDCDNLADYFGASASIIHKLNTAGKATVELRDPKTDKHIGWHRAILIIATENDQIVLYFYEPQNDETCVVRKNDKVQIKNWVYLFNYCEFG